MRHKTVTIPRQTLRQGHRALNLRGARITGGLDLEGVNLIRAIEMEDCWFDEPVNLREARAASIRLPGCHLPSLEAGQMKVHGNLMLGDGLNATSLNLLGAHIDGLLSLNSAILNNPDGTTIFGNRLVVDQGMDCSGLTSRGSISLRGAKIMGGLILTGARLKSPTAEARLKSPTGWALDAQGMTVSYALFIGSSYEDSSGFTAEGGLRLVGVNVDGFVSGWGAHIKARQEGGFAIAALGLQVTQNVLLGEGFTADGKVHLTNARVERNQSRVFWRLCRSHACEASTGDVQASHRRRSEVPLTGYGGAEINLDGASLANSGGHALIAERIVVGDSLLCTNGFSAQGAINLSGAKIGDSADFTGADLSDPALSGLNMQAVSARTLIMRPAARTPQVDLRHASVVVLDDDPGTWPHQLPLRNFSYERFEHESAVSVPMRLDWLQRDLEGYIPQPYEQLASVYRQRARKRQLERSR